ncbi:hypothetical protein BsIDN1_18790 [Bacillus safensis]|uniref:Uncharacterized protein n=1 Tax=Bacillus safensis TaxID=561879 RepID=A0A5S9M5Q7_BACIA|nr:hypothetical protein BsIDN1_18790 [Bacillus safensis]
MGLADQLVNNETGQAYVLVNETLHPMPKGAVMGIPTQISPFITTGFFQLQEKREPQWISSCQKASKQKISRSVNFLEDVSVMK